MVVACSFAAHCTALLGSHVRMQVSDRENPMVDLESPPIKTLIATARDLVAEGKSDAIAARCEEHFKLCLHAESVLTRRHDACHACMACSDDAHSEARRRACRLKPFGNVPLSAFRTLALLTPGGDDDLFSSDFSDTQLQARRPCRVLSQFPSADVHWSPHPWPCTCTWRRRTRSP